MLALMERRRDAGIAARSWLTDRTVETHVTCILSKFGLYASADEHCAFSPCSPG